MTDGDRDLAAGGALGGLSPDEAARLEQDVAKDGALAVQLEEYRAAVATIESGVARERPSPDLFDRVLAQIEREDLAAERPAPERASPSRPSYRRSRRWVPALAGGLAVAATIAVGVAVFSSGGPGAPAARAAVQGTPVFPGVKGEARLYSPDRDDGLLALELADVPAPKPGEHYEVWVLRESAGGRMEAVGVFSPATSDVQLELRLPGSGEYKAVDISVEPDAGPAEHSGRSLAGGLFEATS